MESGGGSGGVCVCVWGGGFGLSKGEEYTVNDTW